MKDFRTWLPSQGEYASFTSGSEPLHSLHHAYWKSFFGFEFDATYIDSRCRAARTHVDLGASLKPFFAEKSFAIEWWTHRIDKLVSEKMAKQKLLNVVSKLFALDISLVTEFFLEQLFSQASDAEIVRSDLTDRLSRAFQNLALGDLGNHFQSSFAREEKFICAYERLTHRLRETIKYAKKIALGHYSIDIPVQGPTDELGASLVSMSHRLRELDFATKNSHWFKMGHAEIGSIIKGDQNLNSIAQKTLRFLCKKTEAFMGTFYFVVDDDGRKGLRIIATFAGDHHRQVGKEISGKEGTIGIVMQKKEIVVSNVENRQLSVEMGCGRIFVRNLIVAPMVLDDELYGVVELGSHKVPSSHHVQFVSQIAFNTALLIKTLKDRTKIKSLLERSKVQNLKLQIQQEKLRKQNEVLKARRSQQAHG